MSFDPDRHHRRSIRLREYDYSSAGAYFLTICVQNKECLFGNLEEGAMVLSDYGRIVQEAWDNLPHHYSRVGLDAFVVMPNHIHGIIVLKSPDADVGENVGAGLRPAPTKTPTKGLSEVVQAFKSFSARRINERRGTAGVSVWQRNYYERIIRGEDELNVIREYVLNNPLGWDKDQENPK